MNKGHYVPVFLYFGAGSLAFNISLAPVFFLNAPGGTLVEGGQPQWEGESKCCKWMEGKESLCIFVTFYS